MVEFALILPVIMALVLGIITGGSAYFRKISLADAAREAARYGASLKAPDLATWRSAVTNRAVQLAGGTVDASAVCTALVVPTGSETSCGVSDPPGSSTDPVAGGPVSIVKVSITTTAQLQFFFFSQTATLNSSVAARYERDIV